jgi:hypothetical protein
VQKLLELEALYPQSFTAGLTHVVHKRIENGMSCASMSAASLLLATELLLRCLSLTRLVTVLLLLLLLLLTSTKTWTCDCSQRNTKAHTKAHVNCSPARRKPALWQLLNSLLL